MGTPLLDRSGRQFAEQIGEASIWIMSAVR